MSRANKKRKKALESKPHTYKTWDDEDMNTLIRWEGDRNKKGYKMYSMYDADIVNQPDVFGSMVGAWEDALMPDIYYVPKTKTYEGDEDIDSPLTRKMQGNIKSKSKSKSPKRLGFNIR